MSQSYFLSFFSYLSGLFLVGSISTTPTLGWSWTSNGSTWNRLPVRYEVNGNSSIELGANTAQQVVNASYASWQAPTCSAISSRNIGNTNSTWQSGDGDNTHIWIYDPNQRPAELPSRQTIGVTLSLFNQNGMVDGDILYNGLDHQWTVNPTRNGQVDAQSIITHEVGHQLGLGHSNSSQATMYASYLGGTGASTLDVDDIEGICALYPVQNNPQCTQDEQCPPNEQCLGGQCQPQVVSEGTIGDSCAQSPCIDDFVCVDDGQGPFCTQLCSTNTCPLGWQCQQVQTNQGVIGLCLPGQEEQGNLGFGEPCQNGPECQSGLCVTNGQSAFCTQTCVTNENCPDQASCYSLSQGGGACVPDPDRPSDDLANSYGQGCQDQSDCESEVCVDDGQTTFCSELCSQQIPCPNQDECYLLENGEGVCIPGTGDTMMPTNPTPMPQDPASMNSNEGELGFNEDCEEGGDCESGICVSNGQRRFCSQECLDDEMCPINSECELLQGGGGVCNPISSSSSQNPPPSSNLDPSSPTDPQASFPSNPPSNTSETSFANDTGCQMSIHIPRSLEWIILMCLFGLGILTRIQRDPQEEDEMR